MQDHLPREKRKTRITDGKIIGSREGDNSRFANPGITLNGF